MAAGKFPLSPMASTQRAAKKRYTLTVETVHTVSPTTCNVARLSLAPSKPTSHVPVRMPFVAMPQNACKQAPADQKPMAHK